MTLFRYEYEGQGVTALALTRCPFCNHRFSEREPRWLHFLEEHDPEDAGLSPRGEFGDSGRPLFDDPSDGEVAP